MAEEPKPTISRYKSGVYLVFMNSLNYVCRMSETEIKRAFSALVTSGKGGSITALRFDDGSLHRTRVTAPINVTFDTLLRAIQSRTIIEPGKG